MNSTDWREVKNDRFQRQVGGQTETRERYYAANCIQLGITQPVLVMEYAIVHAQFSAHTYSIETLDKNPKQFSYSNNAKLYEEHDKLSSLEVLHLHQLLFS